MRLKFAKVSEMIDLERTTNSSSEKLLSPQEVESGITLPQHLVIIPDGNRCWARAKELPAPEGHKQRAKTAENLIKVCREWRLGGNTKKKS